MRLWEIIKLADEKELKNGDKFEGINGFITLIIEYEDGRLLYNKIMGDTHSRDTVSLCDEMTLEYVEINTKVNCLINVCDMYLKLPEYCLNCIHYIDDKEVRIRNKNVSNNNKFKMYLIKLIDYKIQVVCKHCYDNGQINKNCNNCGGKGTHNKTKQKWEVRKNLWTINKIDRDENGELRYWEDMSCYFQESSKLLHFTFRDAVDECNKRNMDRK